MSFYYDQIIVVLFFIVQILIVECFRRRMLDFFLRADVAYK